MYIYKIGTQISHPQYGGCTIQALTDRTYDGIKKQYFVLTPESTPQTTVLIPVKRAEQFGLRAIISSAEADEIIDYFTDVKVSWERNHMQRKRNNLSAAKGMDLMALAKMIKDLLAQGTKAVLCISDKELLLAAQKRLFSEIAMAKGMCFADVMQLTCGDYKRDMYLA